MGNQRNRKRNRLDDVLEEGAETNVIVQAALGFGGGEDRKLLHTHPVNGGWNRNCSGDPENHGIFNKKPETYQEEWQKKLNYNLYYANISFVSNMINSLRSFIIFHTLHVIERESFC